MGCGCSGSSSEFGAHSAAAQPRGARRAKRTHDSAGTILHCKSNQHSYYIYELRLSLCVYAWAGCVNGTDRFGSWDWGVDDEEGFVAMLLPHVALRGGSRRESYWRGAIFMLALGGLGAWFYRTEVPLNTPQVVLLAIV